MLSRLRRKKWVKVKLIIVLRTKIKKLTLIKSKSTSLKNKQLSTFRDSLDKNKGQDYWVATNRSFQPIKVHQALIFQQDKWMKTIRAKESYFSQNQKNHPCFLERSMQIIFKTWLEMKVRHLFTSKMKKSLHLDQGRNERNHLIVIQF